LHKITTKTKPYTHTCHDKNAGIPVTTNVCVASPGLAFGQDLYVHVQSCGLIESNTQMHAFLQNVSIDVSWWNPPKATKEAIGAKRHQLLSACLRFPMSASFANLSQPSKWQDT
jgi:hypothetical protein